MNIEMHNTLSTRRTFLKVGTGGLMALGAGGILAACGSSSSSSTSSSTTAKVGGEFYIYTYEGYDLMKPFAGWRKQVGIDQKNKFIAGGEDIAVVIKSPAGKKIDASSVNQAFNSYWGRLGLLSDISVDEVPGLADMYPFFRDSPIWKNPNGTYNSIPWTWGAVALNYAKGKPKPGSWNDLLDPSLKGRVSTLDDAYNNVSIAAIALGLDLTHITPDQLNGPIKDWLMRLKANVKTFAGSIGDQVNLLAGGEVDYMSVGLSLIDVLAKDKKADVEFTVPKEGGFGYVDALFIPPTAPNRQNAIAFAKQLMTPKPNGVANSSVLGGTPLPDAVQYLDANAKSLYPYDNLDPYLTDELHFDVNYFPTDDQKGDIVTFDDVNKVWAEVKAS